MNLPAAPRARDGARAHRWWPVAAAIVVVIVVGSALITTRFVHAWRGRPTVPEASDQATFCRDWRRLSSSGRYRPTSIAARLGGPRSSADDPLAEAELFRFFALITPPQLIGPRDRFLQEVGATSAHRGDPARLGTAARDFEAALDRTC